jgi:para-nitrobenzyl esterase
MKRRGEVETRLGRVAGTDEGGVCAFRGLPYAQPPLDALRFRAPAPPEPWIGTLDATRVGPAAPQMTGPVGALFGERELRRDEDCLYLNVWTPRADDAARPVLVWIHGGAFVHGSGSQPLYDGSALARRGDAVVVSLNYRLGAFGFLDPAALGLPGAVANAGLLDQVAALRWVREHIAGFGGDPCNVTVFGESAGAMSISCLLAMPAAAGLFQRAILQSGALHFPQPREVAARVTGALLAEFGLLAAGSADPEGVHALPFQPVVDGEVLPRAPLDSVRDGSARGVAVLSGTNLDEWRLFGLSDPKARCLYLEGLLGRVERALRSHAIGAERAARQLVAAYRQAREGRASVKPRDLWFAIESDRYFRLPSIRLTEAQARHGPAYKYLFTWPSPALRGALGACHGLEIPFVFGTTGNRGLRRFVGEGAEVQALSRRMQDSWLAFARSGDPGHPGIEPWPVYDPAQRPTMVFGEKCGLEPDPLDDERRCWDGVV